MRTIVHLSDIHFGKTDARTIQPLIRAVHQARPNLVIVSGDLTQRARRQEFLKARDFLHSLPGPQIVVPGNHDIPIFNPVERFTRPLGRFKEFILSNLFPFYEDEEIAVIGINTARSRSTKYGHINKNQLDRIRECLCLVPPDKLKILVTHHPFDLPEDDSDLRQLVNRAGRAMKILAECHIDILLAGHLHRIFARETAERYDIEGYSALVVQAGTATSFRSSREQNSFNILSILHDSISITRMLWNEQTLSFEPSAEEQFHRHAEGWEPVSSTSDIS
ncbi:MAG TPA: metallophosphoesterase family protein [Candidatus Kapabacteria bacterium]|jgi:3',5'-cyclic AMP phosphodiesterase CpdA